MPEQFRAATVTGFRLRPLPVRKPMRRTFRSL
ncbi:putative structural protein [Agrobacterium phage OLIVR4]|nr:putative structural protein [Agrobacterium phage OLIVR4]